MNELDVFYRALVDYRKSTANDRDCTVLRGAVSSAGSENDRIEVTRIICNVDEEWVDTIEAGLEYLDKAIKEERQFIRSNGEVVPIEKVKHVSKETIEHLARHTDLLSKESDGDEIIPDRLYTVERYNDYTVYENRFLYMLLCYLRDFITMRYNKILELSNTYNANMTMKKVVRKFNRNIEYEVSLKEERKDDWYLRNHNSAQEIIDRIGLILKAVIALLHTPLMEEVSKVAMLKPPITKTNVLKMDNNFKRAVALYSYIIAYDKDGYTIEKEVKVVAPFGDEVSDEFAESVLLSSFLTYEYGLGIKKMLKQEYEEEEQRRKEAEVNKLLEMIKSLRRRIKDSGEGAEEYMIALEKRNRMLENCTVQLNVAKQEIEKLNLQIDECKGKITELMGIVDDANDEIAALNQKYIDDMNELRNEHEEELQRLTAEYKQAMSDLMEKYESHISQLIAIHGDEITSLKEDFAAEMTLIKENHRNEIQSIQNEYEQTLATERRAHDTAYEELQQQYNDDVAALTAQNGEKQSRLDGMMTEYQRLENEKIVAEGRLNALRYEHGLLDGEDFTNKEAFAEIEKQYKQFKLFFRNEWKKTKKDIRTNIFATAREEQRIAEEAAKAAKEKVGAENTEGNVDVDESAETAELAETADYDTIYDATSADNDVIYDVVYKAEDFDAKINVLPYDEAVVTEGVIVDDAENNAEIVKEETDVEDATER